MFLPTEASTIREPSLDTENTSPGDTTTQLPEPLPQKPISQPRTPNKPTHISTMEYVAKNHANDPTHTLPITTEYTADPYAQGTTQTSSTTTLYATKPHASDPTHTLSIANDQTNTSPTATEYAAETYANKRSSNLLPATSIAKSTTQTNIPNTEHSPTQLLIRKNVTPELPTTMHHLTKMTGKGTCNKGNSDHYYIMSTSTQETNCPAYPLELQLQQQSMTYNSNDSRLYHGNLNACIIPHFVNKINYQSELSFSMLCLNIRSLLPKIHHLRTYAAIHQPDVIFITETWCKNTIPDDLLDIPDYTLFRNDRDSKRGGGCAIFTRTTHSTNPLNDDHLNNIDSVWLVLHHRQSSTLLGCIYQPPTPTTDDINTLQNMFEYVSTLPEKYKIIHGDFNLPSIDWKYPIASPTIYLPLINSTVLSDWQQHITEPTRQQNTLDLIFTSGINYLEYAIGPPFPSCDHRIITAKITYPPQNPLKQQQHRNTRPSTGINLPTLCSQPTG